MQTFQRILHTMAGRSLGGIAKSLARLVSYRPVVIALVLGVGLFCRLMQYLPDRSVNHDEAALAVNLLERSYAGLLKPLDFDQGAPVGFLVIEKALAGVLGHSEYALRLFPFVCGLISLFVFAWVAPQVLSRNAALIALALFAVTRGLVYYSTELKQYSSDVLFALLLTALALRTYRTEAWSWKHMFGWGLAGATAVWFSHPSVFVLAGTGIVYVLSSAVARDWRRVGGFMLTGVLWVASFLTCYFLFLCKLAQNTFLLSFWDGSFMPLPPRSAHDLEWFPATFFDILNAPTGFTAHNVSVAAVAVLAFLVGCVALFRSERRITLWMLLAPIGITLLVSGLHKYPFGDRLILFLVPAFLLIIACGAEEIWSRVRPVLPTLAVAFMSLLFLAPTMGAVGKILEPGRSDQIKPMLQYLKDHRQPGDRVFVYCLAWPPYRYYASQYGLPLDDSVVVGTRATDWRKYLDDVDQFKGEPRMWMLFLHHTTSTRLFQGELARVAVRREGLQAEGAAVGLYDFSNRSTP
jgi:hypothetical protein